MKTELTMRLARFVPAAVVLAVFTTSCGSSPTAPSGSLSYEALEQAGSAGTAVGASQAFVAARGVCAVEDFELRVAPSTYRAAQSVGVSFEGDATYCPAPAWSAVPAMRLVTTARNAAVVTVFDDPANKGGIVDVTATILVGASRMSKTIRVSFPRADRQ